MNMTWTSSVTPRSSCCLDMPPFISAPVRAVAPPALGILSISSTSTPCSFSVAAAERPEPPAPITRTCTLRSDTVPSKVSAVATISASMSAPACVMQSVTAFRMALDVLVAPETVSTASVCCSTIFAGMRSIGRSQMPGVSLWATTVTLSIALSDTTTSTFTGPLLPFASAV